MKVVFMGTPTFSVPILEGLIEKGYNIIGVVTQPDKPVGRKRVLTPTPVKEVALKYNIPVLQPVKIREQYEEVLALDADIIITAAYGQIVPKVLLDAPRLGCINVHGSLLPKYRGGAPIHKAIRDGEKETGITIMYMAPKMDAGDMISKRAIPITQEDNVGTVFEKLSLLGRDLLLDTLPSIIEGTNDRIPQKEEDVTYAYNVSREEEVINWNETDEQVFNHIRAYNPWPVAYTTIDGLRMKIFSSALTSQSSNKAIGSIIEVGQDFFSVICGNHKVLQVLEVQLEGKKRMSAKEFLNGVGRNIIEENKILGEIIE